MDNSWGDSLSKEFGVQMPVYGENVNFGSYICAFFSFFQSIYDFLISISRTKIIDKQ